MIGTILVCDIVLGLYIVWGWLCMQVTQCTLSENVAYKKQVSNTSGLSVHISYLIWKWRNVRCYMDVSWYATEIFTIYHLCSAYKGLWELVVVHWSYSSVVEHWQLSQELWVNSQQLLALSFRLAKYSLAAHQDSWTLALRTAPLTYISQSSWALCSILFTNKYIHIILHEVSANTWYAPCL